MHRVYAQNEIQNVFLVIMIGYTAGDISGPMIVKLLEDVDFWIGDLHITYGNVPCVVLLSLYTLMFATACFCTHDLSKEFDLKAANSTNGTQVSSLSSFRKYCGRDALYLYVRQLFTGMIMIYPLRTFPLLIDALRYTKTILAVVLIGASLTMAAVILLMRAAQLTSTQMYKFGIAALGCVLLSNVFYLFIGKGYGDRVDQILLCAIVFTYSFEWVAENTFVIVTLGKLFPSSIQSSVEGGRVIFFLTGETIGSLVAPYVFKNYEYLFPWFILFTSTLLVGMIVRREALQNPSCMEMDYEMSESLLKYTDDY